MIPDQTIKADAGKPRLSLVPPTIIVAIAQVREYGVNKYGDNESWRKVDTQRMAYQCKQCGQILLTEQGMEQHKHKCHYAPPVIEGANGN